MEGDEVTRGSNCRTIVRPDLGFTASFVDFFVKFCQMVLECSLLNVSERPEPTEHS